MGTWADTKIFKDSRSPLMLENQRVINKVGFFSVFLRDIFLPSIRDILFSGDSTVHCITSETERLFYQVHHTTANIKYYCCFCCYYRNISRRLFSCLTYVHIYFLIAKWLVTEVLCLFWEHFRARRRTT